MEDRVGKPIKPRKIGSSKTDSRARGKKIKIGTRKIEAVKVKNR